MAITTVLFDLDGTLLPMDQDVFVKDYLKRLAMRMAGHGYDPEALVAAIWAGTGAMVSNDGNKTNEEVFWDDFASRFGEKAREDEPIFDAFYREEFDKVRHVCGYSPEAAQVIALVRQKGLTPVLATNPIFPAIATQKRIRWAGLQPEDFAHYTTYENCRYCKPNLNYYRDILQKLELQPEECLMVGNDVGEDMVTRQLGMKVFLLTDCIINKKNMDICQYPHGGFAELMEYIAAL